MATDANTVLQASTTKGSSFLAPPAAPSLATATTGGTVAAGYYIVEVAYVDAQGETTPSAPAAIKTTGSTSTITITSPSDPGGATGWYAYVTQVNAGTFTRQQTAGSPTAIATDLTLTAPPTSSGLAPQTANGSGIYKSTALDLITGTPRRGLKARVIYSAASNASGSNTVAWTIEHSDDNTTFYTLSTNAENNLTLSTTAQSGEKFIPFETSKRYVRLVCTITGTGSTPTVTYQGDISLSRP